MNGFLSQLAISLRLHFRNRMALLYGYLFPTLFLIAFWVLYRWEQVPLARHMGELLTVTALGGACFGLPTTMVSERERGVWRRYRLAPVPTASLVASTVLARYVLLVTAGLLQLALAMMLGMPLPRHTFELWVAFTFVSVAFLGLGLVIAALANNVPAVQALGQSIFLPMLIIGGVAVRLESLPEWAQHLSAFFPGRYAVQALQACVTGGGLSEAGFSLLALLLTGLAGGLAGAKMFRWDTHQRLSLHGARRWVAVALAAWLAVGTMAELRGRVATAGPVSTEDREAIRPPAIRAEPLGPPPAEPTVSGVQPTARVDSIPKETSIALAPPESAELRPMAAPLASVPPAITLPVDAPPETKPQMPAGTAYASAPWQAVTAQDIDKLDFGGLPPDAGVVTPIAPADVELDPYLAKQVDCVRSRLPEWQPGNVEDPVQRVRNYLYVAAVPDVFQMEQVESLVPLVVFEQLQREIRKDELVKILYWIASRPYEGDESATSKLREVCLNVDGPNDGTQVRVRASVYAAKLLGRLTGRIAPG